MKKLIIVLAALLALPSCQAKAPTGQSTVTAGTGPITVEAKPGDEWGSFFDGLIQGQEGNACVSPLSYKLALAMAYNGAASSTAAMLSSMLGLPPEEINAWAKAYMDEAKRFDGSGPNPQLLIGNSYWLKKGLESKISKEYIEKISQSGSAEKGEFDNSPSPINKWVKDATKGKIDNILSTISPDAVMYIVNALYFKGEWSNEFREAMTSKEEFTNLDGTKAEADMMHGGADGYIDTEGYLGMAKGLGGGFRFIAVMPKEGQKPSFGSIASASQSADYSYTSVALSIPKFDFDSEFILSRGLFPAYDALFEAHGMDGALSDNSDPDGLEISSIAHKTTFTLAEGGIEASAATAIGMASGSAPLETPKEAAIVFDKPFYFFLTDMSYEPLFFGKVEKL